MMNTSRAGSLSVASLLLVGLLIVAGCSSASSSAKSGSTVTGLNIPFDSLSDFQKEIFEDDEVTFSEYERAIFAHVDCLRSDGIDAGGPELEADGLYSYTTRDPAPGEEESFSDSMSSCSDEYFSAVEFGYADALEPSEEDSTAFYDSVVDCVRSEGIQVEDSSTKSLDRLLLEHPEVYDDCFVQVVEREG